MHLLPTEDQRALARGVREQLATGFPLERLPGGFDPRLWAELTATGVFTLRSELGLGLVEAVLVFEELGRAAVPGPLVATFLAAGHAPAGPVAVIQTGPPPLLVSHLGVARSLLVLDGEQAGLATTAPALARPLAAPLDPLSPLWQLDAVPPTQPLALAAPRRDGALLTAALQTGLAARLTELAVGYAGRREQFGRLIGSFQAVAHLCADMCVRTELARAAVAAAAATCEQLPDRAARAVAGAKLLADEAAVVNARACVQVHGGMGFTWEVPVHYLLKRAWLQATEWGSSDEHAEDLAALL